MTKQPTALSRLTPESVSATRRWVETWSVAGAALERIRRAELRQLDSYQAISLLCGEADYTVPPRAPMPTSGLVEQQRLFMRALERE